MESILITLVQSVVLVPATLLPIINPLGIAPIFAASLGSNRNLASQLARQIAVNSWIIIMVSILTGSYVLALFGISLPVVRVGGGLLVAATAWRMLQSNDDDDVHAAAAAEASEMPTAEVVRRTPLPLTLPLTTGPGPIAAARARRGGPLPPAHAPPPATPRPAHGRSRAPPPRAASLDAGFLPPPTARRRDRRDDRRAHSLRDLRQLRPGARLARRGRGHGPHPPDGVPAAMRRHPEHVDRLGAAPRHLGPGAGRGRIGLALLEEGVDALPAFRPANADHLHRERLLGDRPRLADPAVERLLGPADRTAGTVGQSRRDLERLALDLGIVERHRDEIHALGFSAGEGLGGEQEVLGLGHAAQQRPDDRRVIARRDADLQVAIGELRVAGDDRHIGHDQAREAGADRPAACRAHDRLGTVEHAVDETPGFV